MSDAVRLSAQEVRDKVKAGSTLLVCAYDSDEKFRRLHLEGAISLDDFRSKLPALNKDQEIVFYCA